MEQNLGNIDRLIRLSIGGICLIIIFASHIIPAGIFYGILTAGVILVFNALTGFCLIYRMIGFDTRIT